MPNHLTKVFMFICVFLSINSYAQNDFFSTNVAVSDRSPSTFKQAMNTALLQVLVKASAESPEKLRANPNLAAELAGGERFTSQFSYFNKIWPQKDGSQKNQMFLRVNFSERIILELLKKGGVRFWSQPRNSFLLLPVFKLNGGVDAGIAQIADPSIQGSEWIIAVLDEMSQKYGLVTTSIKQPIDKEKVWQLDPSVINQITASANARVTLVAQINMLDDGRVNGKWFLLDDGKASVLEVATDTLLNFTDRGYFWAANTLANHYSITTNTSAQKIVLSVDGIDSYKSYEDLFAYLQSLSFVDSVILLELSGSIVRLSMNVRVTQDLLQEKFKSDKRLLSDDVISSDVNQINLYWNK